MSILPFRKSSVKQDTSHPDSSGYEKVLNHILELASYDSKKSSGYQEFMKRLDSTKKTW